METHTPPQLIEANFSMIFDTNVEEDAILGLVYAKIQEDNFRNMEKLPALQLPPFVRRSDPNLINAPYYRFHREKDALQIGPNILSFASLNGGYGNWASFSEKILHWMNILIELNIVKATKNVSLKYINVLQSEAILEETNLQVLLKDKMLQYHSVILSTEYFDDIDKLTSILTITNKAQINNPSPPEEKSMKSIVDLTAQADLRNSLCADFIGTPKPLLEKIHCHVKKLFEDVLSKGDGNE